MLAPHNPLCRAASDAKLVYPLFVCFSLINPAIVIQAASYGLYADGLMTGDADIQQAKRKSVTGLRKKKSKTQSIAPNATSPEDTPDKELIPVDGDVLLAESRFGPLVSLRPTQSDGRNLNKAQPSLENLLCCGLLI